MSGIAKWRNIGTTVWHRQIGTGRCEGVGLRIPDLQVFEDSFDHIDIVDERDDAHVAAADNNKIRYLSGEEDPKKYTSSDDHERVFCGNCGANNLVSVAGYRTDL